MWAWKWTRQRGGKSSSSWNGTTSSAIDWLSLAFFLHFHLCCQPWQLTYSALCCWVKTFPPLLLFALFVFVPELWQTIAKAPRRKSCNWKWAHKSFGFDGPHESAMCLEGLRGGCWNFVMRNCTLWRFIFSTATWTAARKSHHIALHCQFGVELTMNYEFGEVFIDFGTFLPLFSLFFFWLMYVRGWGFLFSCSPSNMCRMFFWRFCCADWRRGEKGAKKREWNFLVFVGLIIIVCDTQSRFFSLIPFLRLSWKFLLTLNNVVSVNFRFF